MSILVTIRDADHVATALAEINEFLAHRRRRFPQARASDEVLAIRLRGDLDTDLPDAGVRIHESVAVSGLWSMCWIERDFFRAANDSRERRRHLLHALAAQRGSKPRALLPVFDADETTEDVLTMLQELGVGYTTWLLDHRDRGLVVPRLGRGLTSSRACEP